LLGAAIAIYSGKPLNLTALLWGQVTITTSQLMTHYCNEYFDLEADRLNQTPTNWSGGSRVLLEGSIEPKVALLTAIILAVMSFIANLIVSIFIRPGLFTFGLLFGAQLLAWFYSAPPLRLHSRGIGELTTTVLVTLLTPLTAYYLQAGSVAWLPIMVVIPLCCYQFAMLLSIEFSDAEADRQAGKVTLVVRLGAPSAARLYIGLLLLALGMLPVLVLTGLPRLVALAVAVLFPLNFWQIRRVVRGDWHDVHRWNHLGFYSIVLLVATSAAELAAFILLIGDSKLL
jgi:1,4-dihydroxy-2-naphthoate octaprenyltransferase